jgi:hypothetical protein
MWRPTSREHCRAIDKLPEDTMFLYSPDSVQAEIKYRHDRVKRDFQRPFWLRRKPKQQAPEPCAPELRARPAM